ncbi:MAG: tetratricopeptide repeat protein [Candidatus Riflebacteria bacterium]|nr:tetratricopeptide repeat protein [Candidatus Riflebacteria bacterium]
MENVAERFQKGIDFQRRGLFDLAIDEYTRVVEIEPNNFDAMINLGAAYLQKGFAERSITVLQKVLDLDPENSLALFNLGKAYLYRENHEKALDIFLRAEKVLPTDVEVKKSIANSLMVLGRKAEAVQRYIPILKEIGPDLSFHVNVGKTLVELGNFEQAMEVFKKAVGIAPDSSDAIEGLLRCQLSLDLKDKALTTLKRALMIDPKNPGFHITMVDLMVESGQVEEAMIHLKRAISLDPTQNAFHTKMDEISRRLPLLKKRSGATGLVDKSSPYEVEVYDIIDALYDGSIVFEAAIQKMKVLNEKDPTDLFIAEELANLFFQGRYYEEAVDLYGHIQKSAPESSKHRINLAKSLALAGNIPLAKEFLQESSKEFPNDEELPLALVELFLLEKNYNEAWTNLEIAFKKSHENPHALFLKGFLGIRLGKYDLAQDNLKKVLRIAPDDEEAAVWFSRLMILRNSPEEANEIWNSFNDGIESLRENITRIEIFLSAGNFESARKFLNKIGEYEPQFIEEEILFSKAFFYARDYSIAFERFSKIHEKDPDHPESLAFLAILNLMKNKIAKFWMLWQKAIESDSLIATLTALSLKKVLSFTQLERMKLETKKLLDIVIKNDIDRSALNNLLKML